MNSTVRMAGTLTALAVALLVLASCGDSDSETADDAEQADQVDASPTEEADTESTDTATDATTADDGDAESTDTESTADATTADDGAGDGDAADLTGSDNSIEDAGAVTTSEPEEVAAEGPIFPGDPGYFEALGATTIQLTSELAGDSLQLTAEINADGTAHQTVTGVFGDVEEWRQAGVYYRDNADGVLEQKQASGAAPLSYLSGDTVTVPGVFDVFDGVEPRGEVQEGGRTLTEWVLDGEAALAAGEEAAPETEEVRYTSVTFRALTDENRAVVLFETVSSGVNRFIFADDSPPEEQPFQDQRGAYRFQAISDPVVVPLDRLTTDTD